MSEHGIESPLWLSHRIIEMAHPLYLKKAVKDLIDHLEEVATSGTSPYEIIDRLVQVASTGEYKAPTLKEEEILRKVIHLEDGRLTPEAEKEIQKFVEQLNGVPEAEQTDDDLPYEEWLRKMGIPLPDEEDDDPQAE